MKYVGQSVDIEERFHQHIHSDSTSKIHEAIVEYGVSNFKFEPLIACSPSELDEQEVKFIRLLDSYENGYNQTRGGQHSVFNVEYDYGKYSELKEKLKNKNEDIRSLKQKIGELNAIISSLDNEISDLKEDNQSLTTRVLYLKKELKHYKATKIAPLKRRIATLENGDYALLKKKNKTLESEVKELRFENERIRNRTEDVILSENFRKNNIFLEMLNEKKGVVE